MYHVFHPRHLFLRKCLPPVQVKSAEAGAEALYLSGVGVSRQRKAIVDGLRSSIIEFSDETTADTKDVMDLLLLTQYFGKQNKYSE